MKKNKLLVFLLILSALTLVLASCKDSSVSAKLDIPEFSITTSDGVIFDSQSAGSGNLNFTGSFAVANNSDTTLNFTFYISPASEETSSLITSSVLLDKGKSREVTIPNAPEGGTVLSAVYFDYVQGKDNETFKCAYAFDTLGLTTITSSGGYADFVILPKDIECSYLEIAKPLSIIIESSKLKCETIYLKTDIEGAFEIEESGTGELNCQDFFADALNCTVKTPKISNVSNNPSYYLRVKSYNHKTVNHLDIKIDKIKHLNDLLDENSLPTLYPNTKLTLSSFTIDGNITFNIPVSLSFVDGFTLEKSIAISTTENCEIEIYADSTADLPNVPVKINAPSASVTWDVPRKNNVTLYDIANSMTVAKLNGKAPVEYTLGGDGDAKLTGVYLDKNNNANVMSSIKWEKDGYVFRAKIDTVIDTASLKNAILDLSVSNGGTVKFDASVSADNKKVNLLASTGCYLTVTDKNGNNLRYLIETEYVQSKIPVVCITTKDGVTIESNEEYVAGSFYMNCDEITGFRSVTTESMTIRGRGHSTWKWDKKPYKIKFDSKVSLFGLEAAKDWVLLANYTDKSLIRNYVAMEGAKVLDHLTFVGVQYPVDLFLNGEYLGVYTLGQQIEAKKGRVELTDNGTDVDTGYLLEIGGTSSEDVWNETCFYTTLCKYVKVKAPNDKTLTKEQVAYIRDYVKAADEAVMSGVGYEKYIDIDSLIDWVIVHELFYNIDCAFRRSCYFTKDAGGKLTMGPIWDFDNAFGNFWKDDKTYSSFATADSNSGYIWDNWMSYLINYPEFRARFKARWEEIKYPILEKLLETIDNGADMIDRSAKYNFEKWDILNKRVGCQDSSIVKYNTFEKQIKYFRDWVEKRWTWLNENI